MRTIPTARQALSLPEADLGPHPPRVCLIVPAHNEGGVIADLARSLLNQDYPALRVVFALDRCTDGTRDAVARVVGNDPRFEIIEIEQCPDDWAGKVNAIWRAVCDSRGARDADLLCFADADTVFHHSCVRAAVALLNNRSLDMLSYLSTLTTKSWYELLVQPAASLELARQFPVRRVNRDRRARAFANGQFIMIRRDAYDKLGGHRRVRNRILEDIAIAKAAEQAGLRFGLFVADGILRCRMYPDWPAFKRGWKRIYTEAADQRPARLISLGIRQPIANTLLPLAAAAAATLGAAHIAEPAPLPLSALAAGLGALTIWIATLAAIYRIAQTPLIAIPAHPIGSLFTSSLLISAGLDILRGKPVIWGGKRYNTSSP